MGGASARGPARWSVSAVAPERPATWPSNAAASVSTPVIADREQRHREDGVDRRLGAELVEADHEPERHHRVGGQHRHRGGLHERRSRSRHERRGASSWERAARRRSVRRSSTSWSSRGVRASAPDDPAEQQVGEAGVAGEHRAVEVGAHDPAAHHALAAVAVALADLDRGQGGAAGPGHGASGVVLEAGEHAEVDGGAGRAVGVGHRGLGGEQLADGAGPVDPDGVAVEQAEAGPVGAGGVGEAVAEDLHAGAHRQHDGAAVDGAVQGPALGQLAGGLDLGAVLAAADEVEVARVGGGLAGGDGDDVDARCPRQARRWASTRALPPSP